MPRRQNKYAWDRPTPPVATNSKLVKSARRVLEILEFLDDVQRESTVMEIVEALCYPQSSTSALLQSMVTMGYLVYDPYKRTYLTSSRVALLGNWVNQPFFSEVGIISIMNAMQRETGEVIALGMRNGPHVQYIHVLKATTPRRQHLPLGVSYPLTSCATGYAILATMPDDEAIRIAMRLNAELPENTAPIQPSELRDELTTVRHKGYAISRSDSQDNDSGMIAVALPPIAGQRQMVLALGGPWENLKLREKELASKLMDHIDLELVRTGRDRPENSIREGNALHSTSDTYTRRPAA